MALGGALGALSRYGLGKALGPWNPHAAFSAGTLVANLLGCFLMGALVSFSGTLEGAQKEMLTAFVLTGFLGSLTTFSSFILEGFKLFQGGNSKMLVIHLAAHLIIGLISLYLGYALAGRLFNSIG